MTRQRTYQECADAIWELDSLLEEWFKVHHDALSDEIRDRLIMGMIGYLCSQSIIHQGREV